MNKIDVKQLLANTNNNQRIAAHPQKSIWASANAGAGKTKVLIDRIARLLLTDADPSMILAVTYTKAAAAEMTTRLFQTLGDWSVADDEALGKRLKDLDPDININPDTLSRGRKLFARALETPGGLKIETIHAFCGNILKRFPLEAGIAPGFEVIEEGESNNFRAIALENAAHKNGKIFDIIKSFLSRDNIIPTLENAAKYSGNNIDEIGLRIKNFLGIDKILPVDKAIEKAIAKLDIGLLQEVAQILAGGATTEQKGAQAIENAINSDDIFTEIINNVILTSSGSVRKKAPVNKGLADHKSILKLFGDGEFPDGMMGKFWAAAQNVQKLKIYHDTLNLLNAAQKYSIEYSDIKTRAAKLDFSDLLQKTSALLNRDEGAALWVLYKLDQGLQHVLIDESQDTSAEQWDLLTPLLNALESGERDFARTRFVVGDEKQSIYSFQGASPERYLTEREKFKQAEKIGGVEFRDVDFNMSFRTGQTILNAVDNVWSGVNNIAQNNDDGLETKYAIAKHYSAREHQGGKVEIWPIEMGTEKTTEENAWAHPVDATLESSPVNRLADQIAREIKLRIDNGELIHISKDVARPIEAKDIMILVKTRKALFHQIIKRLKYHNIPVAGSDLIIIKEDPAVLDLIALGRFILRPEDDFNLACVLKGVFCNLYNDDEHLFPLAYDRGGLSLWRRLKTATAPIYDSARGFLQDILNIGPSLTPFEFFAYILERQLPNGKTGWENLISRLGQESKEAVDVLIDLSLKADSMGCGNLLAFLDMVEYESGSQKREFDEHSEGVKVMTVHGSKGREAPIVILPDTTRAVGGSRNIILYDYTSQTPFFINDKYFDLEILDTLKEGEKLKSKAEDNRLLYVAMTRARDSLILCGYKYGTGKNGYAKDSWYSEFENALLENEDFNDAKLKFGDEERTIKTSGGPPDKNSIQIKTKDLAISQHIEIPHWAISEPKKFDPPPKLIAPSGLIDENNEPPIISPLIGGAKSRYLRGQLIHNMLELLPQIDVGLRAEWAQKWGNARIKDDELRNDVISEALKIINDENFNDIFGTDSRAEVAIVGKGKNLDDNIIINGTIDRLIIKDKTITILDYKTNRPPPKEVSGIPRVYINQMAAYRAVLQNQFPEHFVKCALLWTDIPLLMEIPSEILDDAVTKIRHI